MKEKKKFYDWDSVVFVIVGFIAIGLGGFFLYRDVAGGKITMKTLGFAFSIFLGFILVFIKVRELFGKY